jgi:hypothetical protein
MRSHPASEHNNNKNGNHSLFSVCPHMQRNEVSVGIHQYATELENIPEDDRSHEEECFMELQEMIDAGDFSDGDVRVDKFTAASVQNGRFPVKRKRTMRCQKEDCWVLVAEERAGGVIDDVGKHDLWMLCVCDLVKVQWVSNKFQARKELKLLIGTGQQLAVVDTPFGNTVYNEGKFEWLEGSTDADVDVIPSLLRTDLENGAAGQKLNMVTPARCAVCTCMEMTLPQLEVLYVPCMKLGQHG